MRSIQRLGYIVVGAIVGAAGVLFGVGCGDDDNTGVESAELIGAWQFMYVDREGALVPAEGVWQNHTQSRVDRKILFTSEGTWLLSYEPDTGTYIVLGNRYRIDDFGGLATGQVVLDGNMLRLVDDKHGIQIFKKTESFQKYTPPPPPPPAKTFTTEPHRAVKLPQMRSLRLNLTHRLTM